MNIYNAAILSITIFIILVPFHTIQLDDSHEYSLTHHYNSLLKTTYMLPMPDDIELATDVYLPLLHHKPHGAILVRTPYNKNELYPFGVLGALLGWPIIIQDMRGKHMSEGNAPTFRYSRIDGPATISWISNQSWSNGHVATLGPSALGIDQYLSAGANPSQLSCQYIQDAMPNLHKYAVYPGGQWRKSLVEGWVSETGNVSILKELHQEENFTLRYWGNESIEDDWQNVSVPAIHLGGWYDIYTQGIIDGFLGYQYKSSDEALGKSKLIIGPWTHVNAFSRDQGELIYPRNARDHFSYLLFYDLLRQYTQQKQPFLSNWPTVTYYVMSGVTDEKSIGNEWRFADAWPLPSVTDFWYFHDSGWLDPEKSISGQCIFDYDPSDPVPTIGGSNLNIPAGPYDQQRVEERDDVLVFTSDVLKQPYEATGPITARLYVSSNCPDTDFTVKLTDVYPDGRSMLITDGIIRMRNRNGTDHWELMEPGIIYNVTVDLWSTSYIWKEGHRIRVSVSSSNYPRFLNNPNTADGIYQNTTSAIAENTVYMSESYPSCLQLPHITQK